MYAGTGLATDSARQNRARFWARLLAKTCRRLFQAKPLPTLEVPGRSKPVAKAMAVGGSIPAEDESKVSLRVLR
jgi:hypothetical protein